MRKKIDRFTIEDVLSEGSSGSVYKAQEQLPGGVTRLVALKVLPVLADGDRKAEQQLRDELQLCVALSGHPSVVTFYSMGVTDRLPWIAMEYAPSVLSQVMGEQPGDSEQVMKMMRQVAMGLAALHSQTPPVLHNDLSPSNILVGALGDYKISDFGLAGPANVERTRVMATVKYAAPELLSREFGPVCPATDLYALGHVAYEMALGGKLYRQQFPAVFEPRGVAKEATPAKWMAWHCSMGALPAAVHEIRPEFPATLGRVIARLIQKSADLRYASADALLEELREPSVLTPLQPSIPATKPVVQPPALAGDSPAAGEEPLNSLIAPVPLRSIPSGSTSAQRYYVRLGSRISGPFDLPTLQQQIRRGLLSRLHQVSADRVTWRSAAVVDGLFRPGGDDSE